MNHQDDSDEVSSESSSSDDDNDRGELDLEAGAAAGNNNAAAGGDSSTSTSDDEDEDDDEDDDNEAVQESSKDDDNKKKKKKKRKKPSSSSSSSSSTDKKNNDDNDNKKKKHPKKKKSKKEKEDDDDIIQVDFTFCDMDEKYYHGIKNLLHSSSTVYQKHASQLTDSIVNQDIIGTIVSTDDGDTNAYGFATILQQQEEEDEDKSTSCGSTNKKSSSQQKPTKAVTFDNNADHDHDAMEYMKDFCIKNCPSKQQRKQLEKALFDRTNNNNKKKKATTSSNPTTTTTTGFLIHGRTMNLPLEVTLEMHKQLLLDMDWAIQNQRENENYNFSHFVRLAPCLKEKKNSQQSNNNDYIYKFYDDEIMASHSDVTYIVDAPTSYSREEKQYVAVVLVSKKGYQNAIRDIEKMI